MLKQGESHRTLHGMRIAHCWWTHAVPCTLLHPVLQLYINCACPRRIVERSPHSWQEVFDTARGANMDESAQQATHHRIQCHLISGVEDIEPLLGLLNVPGQVWVCGLAPVCCLTR